MLKDRFNKIYTQIIPALLEKGINEQHIEDIRTSLTTKLDEVPDPTIAFIGFTGVGKSSTLNALFNAGQAISDVRACTQYAQVFSGNIEKYTGSKGSINVYDMPGLGESINKDIQHLKIYEQIIPLCDVVIWTFHANDRTMTPMQNAILTLVDRIGPEFTNHLLFVINKADTTAPGETFWNTRFNIPSEEQTRNIKEFEKYILDRIHEILPHWNGQIVTYSAKRRYHLEQLMTAMVQAMPENTGWVLDDRADVASYIEFIDPEYRDYIRSLMSNS
ncbi:MAG: GTPase family protein [Candidatus Scatomorpha sp.]|jgi:predicted GTPase